MMVGISFFSVFVHTIGVWMVSRFYLVERVGIGLVELADRSSLKARYL